MRELGRGGMGAVYEAEHLESGRRVALKVLSHQLDSMADRARFLREGRAAARLTHPNIVGVFDSGQDSGQHYIASSFVPGQSLQRVLAELDGQLLPVEDAGGLLAEAHGETQVIIVVCRDADRQVGIAVSNVLDVDAGSTLFEAGTNQQAGGVTLLKDHVTGIVDLGAVAPLPMQEQAAGAWQPYAESAE